jgi:DNA replication initiation complex subunit (GINS family)
MTEAGRSRDDEDLILRLGEVQAAEKGSNGLTRLTDDFYERTSGHLRAILAELENCNPEMGRTPDEHYYRLSEKLKRAREVLERIYATRERKIVLLALNQSRKGGPKADDRLRTANMLSDEADLFYTLKVDLETVRERLLKYDTGVRRQPTIRQETGIDTTTDDYVEEMVSLPEKAVRPPQMSKASSKVEASLVKQRDVTVGNAPKQVVVSVPEAEGGHRPSRCPDGPEGTIMVKALSDVGPFVLPDGRSITLKKDDIVTLPEPVAKVLLGSGMLAIMGEGN